MSVMSVNLDLNGELHTGKKNPLHIPEIADHMFHFLKLPDIKNCRLVCQKWNQLAVKYLKKLSIVNIINPQHLEMFNQEFPNVQESPTFTCFQFRQNIFDFNRPTYPFVEFFTKWHFNLSEITLLGPDFRLCDKNQKYDLSPLLPSTLIKLQIKKFYPIMMTSTDKISNIRVLDLENCVVNVIPGATLNCVEIKLEDVTFREDEKNLEEFLLNPLLNLDVLKNASFSGKNMILDLQSSHSLDMLTLQKGVKLLNWESSNWEIKKLCFLVDLFEQMQGELSKSRIKYKQLEITLTDLDVSSLPEAIEALTVELRSDNQEVPPRIYGKHNFPELKHLQITLHTGKDFSPFVEFFKHCPKLTSLTVSILMSNRQTYRSSTDIILKTSAVPPRVKTLRVILGIRIIVDRSLQLEAFALFCPYRDGLSNVLVELATELHVKKLYWFGHEQDMDLSGYGNMSENERGNIFKPLIDLSLDKLVVGDFSQVNNAEFEKSFLFPLVDAQGRYYLFQRGEIGKAINGSELIYL